MAKEPITDIALVQKELPAELLTETEKDSGLGVSFKAEDQLLPLIYILQAGSPAVDKRGDNYIEGAEPGDFWLRNALEPIANGVEGIIAIPCEMSRAWIEWLPNRQGFVQRHAEPPPDMRTEAIRGDDGRERQALVRGNGNIIQDTREFFLLVGNQPYVFPCTGTKHTFARQWNTYFKQILHPKTGGIMPSFSRRYKLVTVPTSNAIGKWFGVTFKDMGWITKTDYDRAKTLCMEVRAGKKRAETPDARHEESGSSSDEIPY
jgi:hypothetical protein